MKSVKQTGARSRQRRDGSGVGALRTDRQERHVREERAVGPRVDAELVEMRRREPLAVRTQRHAHRRTAHAPLVHQSLLNEK